MNCEVFMELELKPDEALRLPVTVDPEILGGAPVFRETRVPVKTLFDYIREGYSLEEFLEYFPSVEREDAIAVLTEAERMTLERVAINGSRKAEDKLTAMGWDDHGIFNDDPAALDLFDEIEAERDKHIVEPIQP